MTSQTRPVPYAVAVPILLFAGSFFGFALLFLAAPSIPDGDSYFHLAVAREFGSKGYLEALPWTRLSILGEAFGDKEVLFHTFLTPFASLMDPALGGRLALAALNATIVALVARFAMLSIGLWGALVPLALYATAPMFLVRVVRLRPEVLALILLLMFVRAAAHRRYAWMAALSLLFALSYTAFQVFAGLAVLWFFVDRDWKGIAATFGGLGAGLLAHPGFPSNLKIWWIQNVEFFLHKSNLDVGGEIAPPGLYQVFVRNAGFWILVIALGVAGMRIRGRGPFPRLVIFSGIALVPFTILFVLMERMAIYFVALALLTLFYLLDEVSWRPVLGVVVLIVAIAGSLPETMRLLELLLTDTGTVRTWEADFQGFGKSVPHEATVAAPWGPTGYYVFWAPQGRYLNVLDPIFMARSHADEYAAQRAMFDGVEPDVPLLARSLLRSEFIAFDITRSRTLYARLLADPRVRPVYDGYNFLGRIVPAADRFVVDWRLESGASVPRAAGPARRFEGYVDLRSIPGKPCVRVSRSETLAAPERRRYEFAPYGPAAMTVDGQPRVAVRKPAGAVLGRGAQVVLDLGAGEHTFSVESCSARASHNGFYLLLRQKGAV